MRRSSPDGPSPVGTDPMRSTLPVSGRTPDLGERYAILSVLGRGAMGEVYLAYDAELSREVALKVIRSDHANRDIALERFRREVAHASRVTHPNVLRVYDLAERNGVRFLSMEYVRGQSLANLLHREHPLLIARIVALARQVAEGLAAAHDKGVVHRDLKPSNILVDVDDRVYVADFGLARSLDDATMTATGAIIGTPAYMSPEQVKGDPVGVASDVYSFGVILYELLTGARPFPGDSVFSIMEQRLHRKPAPVRDANPDVPASLERIVDRCTEIEPTERYVSFRDVLADLDRPAATLSTADPARSASRGAPSWSRSSKGWYGIVIGLAVGAMVAAIRYGPRLRSGSGSPAQSATLSAPAPGSAVSGVNASRRANAVVVLGFENRTGDVVFDGTLELVLGYALQGSTAARSFAGPDLRSLANELGADALDERVGRLLVARDVGRVLTVRGSVAPKGTGFALSMTTVDAGTGAVVISRAADVATANAAVPMMGAFGWAIRKVFGESEPSDANLLAWTGLSTSIEADREFTLYLYAAEAGKFETAIAHAERALSLDPEFVWARESLGLMYWNAQRQSEALKQFTAALASLDRLSTYQRLLFQGDYYGSIGEFDKSIAAYEELLQIWPDDVYPETNLAATFAQKRDMTRAIELGSRVVHSHPRNLIARANLVGHYVLASRFDDANQEAARLMADFGYVPPAAHIYVAASEASLGRQSGAKDAYRKLDANNASLATFALADLAASEGDLGEAASLLVNGIAADEKLKDEDGLTLKNALLAEVRLRGGEKAAAISAAAKATKAAAAPTLYMAARTFIEARQTPRAQRIIDQFEQSPAPDARLFAKLLHAEEMRLDRKPDAALALLAQASQIADSWLVHFELGRVHLDRGAFAEAEREFKICIERRGEGSIVYVDDFPTLRYVPRAYYYLGRSQEGLASPDVHTSYRAFLALQSRTASDPLVMDARRRIGGE